MKITELRSLIREVVKAQLKEADMTRQYDGFIVLDKKTKKQYKARYMKGIDNVKVENDAIANIITQTGTNRPELIVYGFIKKGDFDTDKSLPIKA
jgi:hypothetical protein